mmetsp:Transcript_15655/g.38596  ORF Transcript_15655/g.38596 Transcript_15655/m.38596 type:complete len:221 (+) Transcript_15655:746-1408(+)
MHAGKRTGRAAFDLCNVLSPEHVHHFRVGLLHRNPLHALQVKAEEVSEGAQQPAKTLRELHGIHFRCQARQISDVVRHLSDPPPRLPKALVGRMGPEHQEQGESRAGQRVGDGRDGVEVLWRIRPPQLRGDGQQHVEEQVPEYPLEDVGLEEEEALQVRRPVLRAVPLLLDGEVSPPAVLSGHDRLDREARGRLGSGRHSRPQPTVRNSRPTRAGPRGRG